MLEIKMCDYCTNHEYFCLTTRRNHEIDKRSPVLVKPSQVRNHIVPVYPHPPPPQKKMYRARDQYSLVKVARKLKLLNIDDRSALSAASSELALA